MIRDPKYGKRRFLRLLALLCAFTLIAAACGDDDDAASTSNGGDSGSSDGGDSGGDALPGIEGRPLPADGDASANTSIAIIAIQNNPFFDQVRKGFDAIEPILASRGVEAVWINAGTDVTVDSVGAAMDTAVADGFDAIAALMPGAGICSFIENATDAGVVVAAYNGNAECAEESGSVFFHGQDLFAAGVVAGELMCEATADLADESNPGTVGITTESFSFEALEARRLGFIQGLEDNCPWVTSAGDGVESGGDAGVVASTTQDFITAEPNLVGIYVTGGNPFAASAVVGEQGLADSVKVVAFDFTDENVAEVKDGNLFALIGQDPFGQSYDSIMFLYNQLVTGQPPSDEYFIPTSADVATIENIDAAVEAQASGSPGLSGSDGGDSGSSDGGDSGGDALPGIEGRPLPADGDASANTSIAIIAIQNNPFFDQVRKGFDAIEPILASRGVEAVWINAGTDVTVDSVGAAMDTAVADGFDAIAALMPGAGICSFIENATDAGVVVAAYNGNAECAEESGSVFFHGQDLFAAGVVAGELMCEATADLADESNPGTVGITTESFSFEALEARRLGFIQGLEDNCPWVTSAGDGVESGGDAGVVASTTQDFITAEPNLVGIYVTGGNPFAASAVVGEQGLADSVKVVAFDFTDENVAEVKDGNLFALIGQDPFGQSYDSIMFLYNQLVTGQPASDEYFIPTSADVATIENIDAAVEAQASGSPGL